MTQIEDWDAWTHLALGREMVQLRGFPAHEPFNFPSTELPYFNTEWLFAVVFYLAYAGAGFAGVILLKAALASLAVTCLWKDSALGRDPALDPTLHVAIRAAVLFPLLMVICHRFVERPDLVLMVFLSFTIYALDAYLYEGKRYVFLLPALHVVWANMHPSTLLGLVPFGAFLGGGLALRLIHRRWGIIAPGTPSATQLKVIAFVLVATVLASAANPYGLRVLVEPLRLTSPWLMQHIVELQPAPFLHSPSPAIITALLALTWLALARRLPIMSVLVALPFAYLGFSAQRFVFLFVIVAAPIVARNIGALAALVSTTRARRLSLGMASTAVALSLLAISLAVAHVEPLADPTRRPGIGVNDRFLPERALRYLERTGVSGRVFNTFHWGGYVTWRAFPRLTPIIDGRGYVPAGLWETIHFANTNPELLERLYERYGFDVILVASPGMPTDIQEAPDRAISSAWALVYWDDVAVVYLRRSERLAHIVARDEYRQVNPGNGVPYLRQAVTDPNRLPAIESDLRRNVDETKSSIGYTLLGFALIQRREFDSAIEALHRAQGYSSVWHASQGLALAYWQKGDLQRAIHYYKALASLSEDPVFLYNIGLALVQLSNDREAIGYLERARAIDETFTAIYPTLIDAYRRLGLGDRSEALKQAYGRATAIVRAREHLRRAMQFNREGDSEAALAETKAALRLDPRNASAMGSLGNIYFRRGLVGEALTQQRAALAIDPHFADAHYRLALIHQHRAEYGAARKHFEEYVRLQPRSYLAWKAREALDRLPGSE